MTTNFQGNASAQEVIMQLAQKTAFVSIRSFYRKTPTQEITELFHAITHYNLPFPVSTTLPDMVSDIVQVALENVYNAYTHFLKSMEENFTLFFYNARQEATGKSWAKATYSAINSYIHAQNENKGRKQIIQKVEVPVYDCKVYKNGELREIIPAKQEYRYYHSFPILIQSFEATITEPHNYHMLPVSCDEGIQELEDDSWAIMEKMLTPQEMEICTLLCKDYTPTEISHKLGISRNFVYKIRNRAKRKIMESGKFGNSPTVKAYAK